MRQYAEYVPIVLFVLLAVLSLLIIQPFLVFIGMGALLAYLTYPLYRELVRKVKRTGLAAFVMCVIVLLILLIPSAFFVNSLVQESFNLVLIVKGSLAEGLFSSCENRFCQAVESVTTNPQFIAYIQEIAKSVTQGIVQLGSRLLIAVPQTVLELFVLFFTMFYFLKDGRRFLYWLKYHLGFGKGKYSHVLTRLKQILHGVIYGYFMIALIQGAVGAVGFYLFGISSPLFWGLLMGLLALIPFLGTGTVWLPAAIILFLRGLFSGSTVLLLKGVGLALYGIFVISMVDNVLRPKLMGEKAQIHPAVIMLGIFGGILFLGPLGVIFGPLILSMTLVFFNTFISTEE